MLRVFKKDFWFMALATLLFVGCFIRYQAVGVISDREFEVALAESTAEGSSWLGKSADMAYLTQTRMLVTFKAAREREDALAWLEARKAAALPYPSDLTRGEELTLEKIREYDPDFSFDVYSPRVQRLALIGARFIIPLRELALGFGLIFVYFTGVAWFVRARLTRRRYSPVLVNPRLALRKERVSLCTVLFFKKAAGTLCALLPSFIFCVGMGPSAEVSFLLLFALECAWLASLAFSLVFLTAGRKVKARDRLLA